MSFQGSVRMNYFIINASDLSSFIFNLLAVETLPILFQETSFSSLVNEVILFSI